MSNGGRNMEKKRGTGGNVKEKGRKGKKRRKLEVKGLNKLKLRKN
jgi:hypothetical protein